MNPLNPGSVKESGTTKLHIILESQTCILSALTWLSVGLAFTLLEPFRRLILLKAKGSYSTNVNIPFPVADEHTVGVGIDFDNHIFYTYYNNCYASFDFGGKSECETLRAQVWGANDDRADDYVSSIQIQYFMIHGLVKESRTIPVQ